MDISSAAQTETPHTHKSSRLRQATTLIAGLTAAGLLVPLSSLSGQQTPQNSRRVTIPEDVSACVYDSQATEPSYCIIGKENLEGSTIPIRPSQGLQITPTETTDATRTHLDMIVCQDRSCEIGNRFRRLSDRTYEGQRVPGDNNTCLTTSNGLRLVGPAVHETNQRLVPSNLTSDDIMREGRTYGIILAAEQGCLFADHLIFYLQVTPEPEVPRVELIVPQVPIEQKLKISPPVQREIPQQPVPRESNTSVMAGPVFGSLDQALAYVCTSGCVGNGISESNLLGIFLGARYQSDDASTLLNAYLAQADQTTDLGFAENIDNGQVIYSVNGGALFRLVGPLGIGFSGDYSKFSQSDFGGIFTNEGSIAGDIGALIEKIGTAVSGRIGLYEAGINRADFDADAEELAGTPQDFNLFMAGLRGDMQNYNLRGTGVNLGLDFTADKLWGSEEGEYDIDGERLRGGVMFSYGFMVGDGVHLAPFVYLQGSQRSFDNSEALRPAEQDRMHGDMVDMYFNKGPLLTLGAQVNFGGGR